MSYEHINIAVVAGTHVDTQMGVDFLKANYPGINAVFAPTSDNAEEQFHFQHSPADVKMQILKERFKKLMEQGIDRFFIYCNSLSGAVDFPALSRELGVPIVTPHIIYSQLAVGHKVIGAIAANNVSLNGIANAVYMGNPYARVVGASLPYTVDYVEAKDSVADTIYKSGLDLLPAWFERMNCEMIILGCTHFPYFAEEFVKLTSLPVIDPAKEMADWIISQ